MPLLACLSASRSDGLSCDAVAELVAHLPRCEKLKMLLLEWCAFGDAGAQAIADQLPGCHKAFIRLNVSGVKLSDPAVALLRHVAPSKSKAFLVTDSKDASTMPSIKHPFKRWELNSEPIAGSFNVENARLLQLLRADQQARGAKPARAQSADDDADIDALTNEVDC